MTNAMPPSAGRQKTIWGLAYKVGRRLGMRASRLDVEAVEATGLFDRPDYLARYPEVAALGIDPVVHYLDAGAHEGRNPCALFDSAYYLEANPDVAAAKLNPLLHFCEFGWRESRHPSADFDVDWYLANHLAGAGMRVNPLLHYLTTGRALGLEIRPVADSVTGLVLASGVFDEAYYRGRYPEIAATGTDLVADYLRHGVESGRNPSALFDTRYYLLNNPDVERSGENPLAHFCRIGWKELRNPSRGFDVWWYWSRHLDPAVEGLNPLGHYQTVGREQGLAIRPASDSDAELIRASGVFDASYYREQYPDVANSGADPVAHYLRHGAKEGRNPSALFDTRYYLLNNPDVGRSGENPLAHFCRIGWKELCNPSRDFDVWWYWSRHLDPAVEGPNPLAHYQAVGRRRGLDIRPHANPSQLPGAGHRHPAGRPVRRICLFAGYDRDGIVDDYVIAYVRELARHADVYYLADCEMRAGELDKLGPHAKGAWAERHGAYDFGSHSRLLQRLGWDHVCGYDELLLVNDSSYLLRPLDDVFAEMDARTCDWWGLQATKGIAATIDAATNRFRQPIPMDAVRGALLGAFERDYTYDFLVGSYFLACRRPVLEDAHFRRLMGSVGAEASKKTLILKYEAGLTRHLIARGHAFDTFIDALYPFHPVFTNWYFRLLEKGFPLLKRYLLSENHYSVPNLHDWAERIREKVPDADIDAIRRNLDRVVDPGKLHRNLHIGSERQVDDLAVPAELLDDREFAAADRVTPKHRNWWAFPVCAFTGAFSGNERALFEEVKDDPSIRKIVLTRGKQVEVDGANVEVLALESPLGQHRLMRAANMFIKHSPARNLVYPVSGDLHNIINLWHGIPFKRIGYASADMQDRLEHIAAEHGRCRAVISSSRVDALAMASSFYPLSIGDVWNTGLPRNDFILRARDRLPEHLRVGLDKIEALLGERRLVLFMPTFRNAQEDAYYRFSDDEVAVLGDWLRRSGAVLGVREHMADDARVYGRQLKALGDLCLDLSDEDFPDAEMLYRASSALITDYSSSFIDYMLTGKPAVSFAYDYDRYLGIERGAFYDLEFVFPGPVCFTFAQLRDALERIFDPPGEADVARREWLRGLFFDYVDDRSSARVAERVRQLTDVGGVGKPPVEWSKES